MVLFLVNVIITAFNQLSVSVHMVASMAPKFAQIIPRALAALPGIEKLPWPGPFKYLPQPIPRIVAEKVFNWLFKDQLLAGDLEFLNSVTLRVQVKDLSFDWAITKQGDKLRFCRASGNADTTFSGNSREFLLLASRRQDPDTLFFQRRLSIEGDTELGLEIKNFIDSVDMDEFPSMLNHALFLCADFVERLPQGQLASDNHSPP